MTEHPHEGERARLWRESLKLSRRELAEITGYSESAIQDFEAGFQRGRDERAPIGEREMLRYRLACAAIDAGLNFRWEPEK
ncbi:helix-turn-helix domain-containing protein [Methylosinus sporium]|uniref:HTH cro/C1-type domain-containing protein n=1 Tax=Methylosinus sporium TaxID=428 RepID=A0A2U1SSU3_METSR|nr:helix-turn-helix transcriptional regulator [Methylosinus sporium]PWB94680.1 hypothetical protein C5689_06345 [Methylosinus sporium]